MVGRLLTVALTALVLSSCSDSSAPITAASDEPAGPSFAQTVTQTHSDFGPIATLNPCEPEPVVFSGKIHQVVKIGDDGSIDIRTNFADLKGIGLVTGNEYVLQQNNHQAILDPLPPPIEQTLRFHSRVISRGSAENFHVTFEQHVLIAPPAAPVVTTTVSSECRG